MPESLANCGAEIYVRRGEGEEAIPVRVILIH